MKYFELDKYEKDILEKFERGQLKRTKDSPRRKKELREAAGLTLIKTKNINLRLSTKDLHKVRSKAAEQGIPYQTLLASLIHQYTSGKIRVDA